ncbi:MAG: glycosyltransferase family 2 protein [Rhodomicrobium sp.]
MPEGSPWPRISIVTPSFNQGQYIEETIRSVLLQGYPNLEYIIIDGGSTDNSVEIIKKYEKWLTYWVSEADRGQSHAINKGFARSTALLGNWLNSDDVLLRGALKAIANSYRQGGGCGFIVGRSEHRNPTGEAVWHKVEVLPLHTHDLLDYFLGVYIPQPSCFFELELYRKAGKLDETLHYAMDLDLWLKLASFGPGRTVDAICSWTRVHENAKTFSGGNLLTEEVEAILLRRADKLFARRIKRAAMRRRIRDAYGEFRLSCEKRNYCEGFIGVAQFLIQYPEGLIEILPIAKSKMLNGLTSRRAVVVENDA